MIQIYENIEVWTCGLQVHQTSRNLKILLAMPFHVWNLTLESHPPPFIGKKFRRRDLSPPVSPAPITGEPNDPLPCRNSFIVLQYKAMSYLPLICKEFIGYQQLRGDYVYSMHSQYEILLPLSILTSFLEYCDFRFCTQIETYNFVIKRLIIFMSFTQRQSVR